MRSAFKLNRQLQMAYRSDHHSKPDELIPAGKRVKLVRGKMEMNIRPSYQSLFFVHIPKCAGKHIIEVVLAHEVGQRLFYIGHPVCTSKPLRIKRFNRAWTQSCADDPNYKKSFVISTIRNPFDLLVSMYEYGFPYLAPTLWYGEPYVEPIMPFDTFEEFIRAYCDPDYPWLTKPQQKFLFFQIFGDGGECGPIF